MPKSTFVKNQQLNNDSSVYAPEDSEESSMAPENQRRNHGSANQGKWSDEQNFKYVAFMIYHRSIFSSRGRRKIHRIFKKMSEYLKTRQPRQCRSHYQKLIKRFKNLATCQKFLMEKIGSETFAQKYQQVVNDLETYPKLENDCNEPSNSANNTVGIQTDFQPFQIPNPVFFEMFPFWNQNYQFCYPTSFNNSTCKDESCETSQVKQQSQKN